MDEEIKYKEQIMTKEEIIKLAKEADAFIDLISEDYFVFDTEQLKNFVELIITAKREACAKQRQKRNESNV